MPGMKPDVKYEINLNIKQGLSCFQLIPCFLGGARRNRTDDLYNAIVALSQLSYGPKTVFVVAGLGASTCGRREHNYPATQRKRNLDPGVPGVKKISACD